MSSRKSLLFPRALAAALAIATAGLRAAPTKVSNGQAPPGTSGAPILAVPVSSFEVREASMAEALRKLRDSDVARVVIGFERIPHAAGSRGVPITLSLRDTTVGGVVRRLCQADARYEYEVIKGQMVEVRPTWATADPRDLLNMRIRHYAIDADAEPEQVITSVPEDAPELRRFLARKRHRWAQEAGVSEGGSAGSILSGNMTPPRFSLNLRDVTVRQILDAISLKSIRMFETGKYNAANGTPLRSGPVGWQYDFVLDPDASTGLGGYPSWKPF